jgi:hypothetical protein
VYYGAYVYFEKLRVAEGKPKSAKREKMEVEYGHDGGVDRKENLDGGGYF